MKLEDHIYQVHAFLSWHTRAGGNLAANFRWWAESKDFRPEDEEAIRDGITKGLALVKMAEPVACLMD